MARRVLLLCILVASTTASFAEPQISTAPDVATAGRPITVIVERGGQPVRGAQITVAYRPGSRVVATEGIGVTDEHGRVAWVPETAGLVRLSAEGPGDAAALYHDLGVRFARTPQAGILVLAAAGAILAVGAGAGLRRSR